MARPTKVARRTSSKKAKNAPAFGQAHVFASFNNTIVTFTDQQGQAVCWGSAGTAGFKGSRKSTPYAARMAAQQAAQQALNLGMSEVDLFIKGPGPGREAAIRAIQSVGMRVRSINAETPIPHNGCRPPKRRRV
jgi:small subunit ribosomal protein S11